MTLANTHTHTHTHTNVMDQVGKIRATFIPPIITKNMSFGSPKDQSQFPTTKKLFGACILRGFFFYRKDYQEVLKAEVLAQRLV